MTESNRHLDIAALHAAAWSRIATDAAGAAVRALLGAGAASVVRAAALRAESLPARPLLAYRRLPISGAAGDIRQVVWIWYVYDEVRQGYWRINQLISQIQIAYPAWGLAHGETTTSIGGEEHDEALGLMFTPVRIIYTRRA